MCQELLPIVCKEDNCVELYQLAEVYGMFHTQRRIKRYMKRWECLGAIHLLKCSKIVIVKTDYRRNIGMMVDGGEPEENSNMCRIQ